MICFAPRPQDGDFSANHIGVIGDSADKRFTFVRTDWKTDDPTPPEYIHIIDWNEAGYWRRDCRSPASDSPAQGTA